MVCALCTVVNAFMGVNNIINMAKTLKCGNILIKSCQLVQYQAGINVIKTIYSILVYEVKDQ